MRQRSNATNRIWMQNLPASHGISYISRSAFFGPLFQIGLKMDRKNSCPNLTHFLLLFRSFLYLRDPISVFTETKRVFSARFCIISFSTRMNPYLPHFHSVFNLYGKCLTITCPYGVKLFGPELSGLHLNMRR